MPFDHPSFREEVHRGIVLMAAEEYHAFPAASSHGLMKMLRSPAHYEANWKNPKPSTKTMEFGDIIHKALLEPRRFRENFKLRPKFDLRTTIGKAKAADWDMNTPASAIVIPEEKADAMLAMVRKLQAHPAANLVLKGKAEVCYFWKDPVTGLQCKAMVDYLRETDLTIVDLKTTVDASYEGFQRAIARYNYELQAAHYCEGYYRLFGAYPNFIWMAIENEEPHEIGMYNATEWWLDRGKRRREKAMKDLAECLEKKSFPGYPTVIRDSFPPNYLMYEED